jgi:hypothetical protein
MMSFSRNDREDVVNQELNNTYGFGLPYFELGLKNIKTWFDFIKIKKKKAKFEKMIDDLESEKRKLIEHIDDFLSKSKLWDEIQSEDSLWLHERKVSYIKDEFNLSHFFEKIDKNIRSYRKKIEIVDGFHIETEEKKKRVQQQTLISLIWYLSMFKGAITNTQKFRDIRELLFWLTENKTELMEELFGEQIHLDESVIKANYDRYINNPSESQKIYKDIAESICAESLFPVDE